MEKFRWNGQEYPKLTRPTFGEIAYVERLLKLKYDDWSSFDTARAETYLAIRRIDHTAWPWAATEDASPEDFEAVPDEPAEETPDHEPQ